MTIKPDTAKEQPNTWTQGGQAKSSDVVAMERPDNLTLNFDEEGQRLIRRYRDAYNKLLETPENQRGPKNGYKKRMADKNAAASELALWVEVIAEQAEQLS
ncbi:hypothetical protein ACU684_19555 [Pseudomonas sp. LF135]